MTDTDKSARSTAAQPDWAEYTRIMSQEIRETGRPVTGYFAGQQVLLLTTTGSRTGQPRTSAVTYTRDGDRIIVVASKSGAPTDPAWFTNLAADPIVTIELDRRVIQARASVAEGAERQRLWDQHAAVHPQFKGYLTKTDRVIPVVILEPIGG